MGPALAMGWTDLPRGTFTRIDWSRPGATDNADPYLVWAEADNFAGYGLPGPPKWLPLLIELYEGCTIAQLVSAGSPAWLDIAPVYTSTAAPQGLRFCTARVRPRFFREIESRGGLRKIVRRFELGLPVGTGDDRGSSAPRSRPQPALLKGPVVGLIDGGLAFAHANFLRNGKARTRYFWRQDAQGVGSTPPSMGYGHELTAGEIEEAIRKHTYGGVVDESAVYRQFGMGLEMEKRVSHGTHVLDAACGPRTVAAQMAGIPPHPDAPPSWTWADDTASRCDVLAVQLDWDTIRDTSGGSMNVHIMDGLMYMLSKCAPSATLVVNLSWGTLAGPHDGTSLLESAMDQLIELQAGALRIVLPVSNNYQSRTHANVKLEPGEQRTLHWRALPGDVTQNFLELWFAPGATGVSIEVTPPGRAPLPPLRLGESKMWTGGSAAPLCSLVYPRSVATGLRGTCALLALAPTASLDQDKVLAPSGAWEIRLHNKGVQAAVVDAYIERDDEIIGVRTGARQSHFEDHLYDTSGNPGSFVDDPTNPTLIRRSGSFNSIATGSRTVTVGGTRVTGTHWARYSPRRPDPDHARPERPGVVKMPAASAYSDENGSLLGLRAAGTRSGCVVRLVGTSDAAPQITRDILNTLG